MTSRSKEILNYFSDRYAETLRTPYLVTWGRDQKLIREFVDLVGDKIFGLIDLYFTRKQNLYSLPLMKLNLNELIQQERKMNPTRKLMPSYGNSRETLE